MGEMTMDTVRQELNKHATAEDQIVTVKRPADSTAGDTGGLALVELKSRNIAEMFFADRSKMPFTVEWEDKPPGWKPPTAVASPRRDSGMLDETLAATLAADSMGVPVYSLSPGKLATPPVDEETDLDRLARGGISPAAKVASAVASTPSPTPAAMAAAFHSPTPPVAPAVFGAAVRAPVSKEQ